MLEVQEALKSYGGAAAVGPVSHRFAAGATTVLLGPSGCGKSTLLRLLMGLVRPDSGRVLFDGRELGPDNARELRLRMGYVIQDGGLFPHLTARGNAALAARHVGWDGHRIESRLAELAELTHFPREALDRYPVQLSGGQCQRVSLMRALMLDPEVLLFDEPLGALDPMIRADLQTDLAAIFRELSKTVVIVTHDIGEAGFFGHELLLLRDGLVVQRGSLQELVRQPAEEFVERFVGAQRSPLEGLTGDDR